MENERKEAEFIVGIGASAGGLEALERFFGAVRPSDKVAYILVQHLSPDFESMMGEILRKLTSLRVETVVDGMAIESGTIYLNAPRVDVTVQDGRLRVSAVSIEHSIYRPIDALFDSLAKEQKEKAIAIVLSGTGTDGAKGVKRIADHSGIVLTQNLESALFSSMPQAASEAVKNNSSAPPEEMPILIREFVKDPSGSLLRSMNYTPDAQLLNEETALSFLLSLLQRRYETDFSKYKPQTIVRRLERRLSLENAGGLAELVQQAMQDDAVLDQIYRELLIDVTRFFRDKEGFNWLEKNVIPQLIQQKTDGQTVRVWVSACSSGEEAYSLAILFLEEIERQQKDLQIRFFASDLHRDSISVASSGIYPAEAVVQIPHFWLEKYFHQDGKTLRVRKKLRQTIVFTTHDLLSDPYFSNQDLISCRNMLIYIRPEAQAQILEKLTASLRTEGILFLGPSEYMDDKMARFYETASRHWRIFKKTSSPSRELPTGGRYNIKLPPHLQERKREPLPVYHGWEKKLLQTLIPAGFVCNNLGELKEIYGEGSKYIKFSIGRVNLNLTELMPDSLSIALRNCLSEANREKQEAIIENIQVKVDDEIEIVNMKAIPFDLEGDPDVADGLYFLISIEEVKTIAPKAKIDPNQYSADEFTELHSLKLELAFTRENLQKSLEEIEASNEELQSSNEELTAANEEMQSTNEELSSVNEELYTVNAEYQEQNKQLNQLFNDKYNLELASGVLTFFLDEHLHIREMTPACYRAFDLIDGDRGRSILQFSAILGVSTDELQQMGEKALSGDGSTLEIQTQPGTPMLMSAIPYQEEGGTATGIILNFVDLTDLKGLQSQNQQLVEILDAIPALVTYIGKDYRYKFANHFFRSRPNLSKGQIDPVGRTPKEILIEGAFETIKPYHDRAFAGEMTEFVNKSRNITGGHFKNILIPNWANGEVDGVFVLGFEVTEFEMARQETMDQLVLSEARFKSVVDTQSELITRWRPDDFVLTFANPAYNKIYGNGAIDDLVGSSLLDHVDPEYSIFLEAYAADLIRSGEPQQTEETKQMNDGTLRHFLWTDTPIFDKEGKIVEIQGIGRDVTSERKVQNALEAALDQINLVNNSLPVWISQIDRAYRCLYLNDYYAETFGIDTSTAIGAHLRDVIGEAAFEKNQPHYARVLNGEKVDYVGRPTVEGTQIVAELSLVPHLVDGEVESFFVFGRDVTAERAAQKALALSEARYRSIVEHSPDLIDRYRPDDFVLTYVNEASAAEHPTTQVGRSLLEYFGEDEAEIARFKAHVAKIVDTKEARYYQTVRKKGDQNATIEWREIPILDEEGNVVEIQAMGRDISAELAAQKKLEESEDFYRSIANHPALLISHLSVDDFSITYSNEAYNRAFPHDVSFGNPFDAMTAEEAENARRQLSKVVESREAAFSEEVIVKPDGGRRLIYWFDYPKLDEKGAVVEIQSFGVDVTAQDTQSELKTIHDNLPLWIAVVDREHRFQYLNKYHEKLFGHETYKTAVGKKVAEVLGDEAYKVSKPYYDRAFAGERVIYQAVTKLADQETHMSVQMVPQESDGEIQEVYVMVLNISALNQREAGAEIAKDEDVGIGGHISGAEGSSDGTSARR